MNPYNHIPVLLKEAIDGLSIKPEGIYVDGTVGGGGHSAEIAGRLTTGVLIGIDQDPYALKRAKERLAPYGERVRLIQDNFSRTDEVLDKIGIENIDGALLDIGVSSFQFDMEERGFSYRTDAPLDMRMSQESELTAADIIQNYTQKQLEVLFWDYGEERWAKRIAAFIEEERKITPIETTGQLVQVIKKAIPQKARAKSHPARKVFQALRIEVNDELHALEKALGVIVERLNPGGRFCVITFHSLEDRIVKNKWKELSAGCICPKDFPVCVCNRRSVVKIITRKPILPTGAEVRGNRRARSAKLRIVEKLP